MDVADRLARVYRTTQVGRLRRIGELGETYLVGGAARDLLLGRSSRDIDITIVGDGLAFADQLVATFGAVVIESSEAFGTAKIEFPDGDELDVAAARRETYREPAALPDVMPAGVEEDLGRRDFTINSMAVELRPDRFGALLDLFGGLDDLNARVISILHQRSFIDDPTRLFRAVRYERRFSFRLTDETLDAARDVVTGGHLARLSGARVGHELLRAFEEPSPEDNLARLDQLGVMGSLARPLAFGPEDRHRLRDVREIGAHMRERGVEPSGRALFLAWLARWAEADELIVWLAVGAVVREAMERVRAASDRLKRALRRSELHRTLSGMSADALAAAVGGRDDAADLIDAWIESKNATPWITGDDLIALGYKPGPAFGRALEETFDAQLNGQIESPQRARAFAESVLKRVLGEGANER